LDLTIHASEADSKGIEVLLSFLYPVAVLSNNAF